MIILFALIAVVAADTINLDERPMENPDLFDGDMLGVDPDNKNVIPGFQFRWPAGNVPYVIDPSLAHYTPKILEAMQEFETKTCIRFKKRTLERNFVRLFSGQGCYSYVGMLGGGQPLSLGTGCRLKGTIVHELGHVLGFYHEQNRSDRDNYIIIYWNNIKPAFVSQFQKLHYLQNHLLDYFDYNSIMIFGNAAFSRDNRSYTMVARNGYPLSEPFDKPGLSASDVRRLRKMYWCDEPWQKNKQ